MNYYSQDTNYTCGCACFRMVLSQFGDDIPSEKDLEIQMNTSIANTGTSYDDMVNIGKKYGLDVQQGVDGDLDHLDTLRADGWVVVLGISLDVPHFVIYLGNNGNHIFMHDPFRGAKSNFQIKKFLRNNWDINHKKYYISDINLINYPDLVFDPKMDRKRYWLAYKKGD